MKYDLIITNGLVCAESGMFRGGIGVKDGKIAGLLPAGTEAEADKIYDAKGNIIFPGVIDPHTHFGLETMTDECFTADLETETRAAAQGGITTVNTTTLFGAGSVVEYYNNALKGIDKLKVNVKYTAAPGNDAQVAEMATVFDKGVNAFKFLLGYRGASARMFGMAESGIDTGMMYRGFEKIAELGAPAFAMIHAEDPNVFEEVTPRVMKEPSTNDIAAFHKARPSICETIDVAKAAHVANEVGCPLYCVHITAKESVDLIAYLKSKGFDVIGETCIHYLLLACDTAVFENNDDYCRLAKVNPPIRERADMERLWQGIREGIITCVGTDHTAYTIKNKLGKPFWETVCGCGDGMSVALPLMFSEGVNKNKINLETLRKIMCENPAKAFGLYPQKGTLALGSDADIVIIDPKKKMIIDFKDSESANEFSLYQGWEVTGVPTATFVAGTLVAEDYKIVTDECPGKLLSGSNITKVKVFDR